MNPIRQEIMDFSMTKMAGLIAGILSLSACTEKVPEEAPEPKFPEKQVVTDMIVGEPYVLAFVAEADWSLSVDKSYVRFVDKDVEKSVVSGTKGDSFVTVLMKDSGQGFEDDMASVTMKMGPKSAVIFDLVRPAKERKVTVWVKKSYPKEEGEKIAWMSLMKTAQDIRSDSRPISTGI